MGAFLVMKDRLVALKDTTNEFVAFGHFVLIFLSGFDGGMGITDYQKFIQTAAAIDMGNFRGYLRIKSSCRSCK
jgi:hypothetical protein